jgi:hypothetical protein
VTIRQARAELPGLSTHATPALPLTVKGGAPKPLTVRISVYKRAALPPGFTLPHLDLGLRNRQTQQRHSHLVDGAHPRDPAACPHAACGPHKGALRAAPRTRNGSHTEVTLGYLCRNRAMRSASHRPRSARHPPPRRHTPARKDQDHPKFLSGTACSSRVNICSPHPKVPIAPTAPAHEHRVITRASHPSLPSSAPHPPALIVTASHRAAGRVCCTALYHPSTARRDTRPQPREPRQGED